MIAGIYLPYSDRNPNNLLRMQSIYMQDVVKETPGDNDDWLEVDNKLDDTLLVLSNAVFSVVSLKT